MRLKVGEHNYKVWFEYSGWDEPTRVILTPTKNLLTTRHPVSHQTSCHIMRVVAEDRDEPFVTGFSLCKLPDKFVKEEGRKKALTSALRRTSFDRDERRQFWEAYRNRALIAQAQSKSDLKRLKKGRGI